MTVAGDARPNNSERRDYEQELTDNLEDLLGVLPPEISDAIRAVVSQPQQGTLIEVVMDLGRRPEARLHDREVFLLERDVTRDDLRYVSERIGTFGDDNRAGIERTLHRISAIRNRSGEIVGLTCRIGRAVYGTIAIIRDLVESGESILLLGRPGVGKTTMLREMARVVADELRKRVVIVDTSNEIAGDGDIPHPAIGRARRMQVPTPLAQHSVMIEAVENHMPQVIVIDEIGTELEAMAARTIAERGVQLIGTAHGNTLENLMLNPTLSDLVGGIQSVTLSDEEARRRGTQKSILERKAPPTFSVMVEIINRDEVAVHLDVAATVDAILRGVAVRPEHRLRKADGETVITKADDVRLDPTFARPAMAGPQRGMAAAPAPTGRAPRSAQRPDSGVVDFRERTAGRSTGAGTATERAPAFEDRDRVPAVAPLMTRGRGTPEKPLRIFPFGVSRNRLEQVITQLRAPAVIVRDLQDADLVITLKNYYRRKPQPLREAEARGTSVYVLRSNTGIQMEGVISALLPHATSSSGPVGVHPDLIIGEPPAGEIVETALEEAEEAITAVIEGAPPITLAPQDSYVRKLQHQLADRYNLGSRSTGREPNRRVEIFRMGV